MTMPLSDLDAAAKAQVLIESLPWLKRFAGSIMVVKFGGNAMVDDQLKRDFAADMVYLRHAGIRPVVVHGGGPQISAELARRGIASEFRGGYRVTTPEAMAVVREVLATQVNSELVELINEHGAFGVGLSGETRSSSAAAARRARRRGRGRSRSRRRCRRGRSGDRARGAGRRLHPVIASVAPDLDAPGSVLNVNADSAAAALAVALEAAKLVVLTDVAGLYSDWPRRDSLVSHLTAAELTELLPTLESGMIPKMAACLEAVEGGVEKAAIIDGRIPHSILLEIFTQQGIGTEVVAA